LEIQICVSASDEKVSSLLRTVAAESTPVNAEIAARFASIEVRPSISTFKPKEEVTSPNKQEWLPNARQPSDLFVAYSGKSENLSRASLNSALIDLSFLSIPEGLSEDRFGACVRAVLMQHQLFNTIWNLSSERRRFGEYRALVKNYCQSHHIQRDAADTLQVSMRWLLHFFPENFDLQTPNYSEILVRRK
jgi:hypothetical protein